MSVAESVARTAAGAAYESLICASTQWRVHPEWKEALLGPDGLRMGEWLAEERATVVKSRSHRTVYRVDLPQGSFYVKEYRSNAWRDVVRDLLRGNRAVLEWRRLLRVRQRGIATVSPLGVGVPRRPTRGARAWLITAAERSQPLDDYLEQILPALPPEQRTRARQYVARRLAQLVASLHDAGIAHRDLHPGNVLIAQPGPSGATDGAARSGGDWTWVPRSTARLSHGLLLVDLQAVSMRRGTAGLVAGRVGRARSRAGAALDWRQSRRNLITLNLYFSQHATRADRRRFWQHYLACRPGLVTDPSSTAREIERHTARAARRFWRRRDRRCVRQGRYFYRRTRAGLRAFAVRDIPEATLGALLERPDAPFETSAAQFLKRSSGSQVVRLELGAGANRIRCVYKRWRPRSLGDVLLSRFRTSKAMHAWRMGHALLQRGIATPRPLAVIELRTFARGICSYVLWEEIGESDHLHGATERIGALAGATQWRGLRSLAHRLARLLRHLHEAGFVHRDLKAANVLVKGPPEALDGIYLLDLDSVGRRRCVGFGRRMRDLSRLLVSFYRSSTVTRSEKLRFFDDYLYGGLDGHANWKAACRYMDQRAQRKIRRNQRFSRVIG